MIDLLQIWLRRQQSDHVPFNYGLAHVKLFHFSLLSSFNFLLSLSSFSLHFFPPPSFSSLPSILFPIFNSFQLLLSSPPRILPPFPSFLSHSLHCLPTCSSPLLPLHLPLSSPPAIPPSIATRKLCHRRIIFLLSPLPPSRLPQEKDNNYRRCLFLWESSFYGQTNSIIFLCLDEPLSASV